MTQNLKRIFLAFCIIIISGCSSSDNDNDNDSGESFMKATIDAEAWESSSIDISNLISFSSQNFQQYLIKGANDNFKITVAVNEPMASDCITPDVYSGDFVSMDYAYKTASGIFLTEYYNDPFGDSGLESNTVVTITECNNGLISGTFSGTLYKGPSNVETVSITDGEFQNIPFTINQN